MLLLAAPAAAQDRGPDSLRLPLRLGLTTVPPLLPPLQFRVTSLDADLFRPMMFGDFVAAWSAANRRRLEERTANWFAEHRFPLQADAVSPIARTDSVVARADTVAYLPPPPVRTPRNRTGDLLPGQIGEYADLSMRITGLGELGGSWTRFKPCDPSLFLNCNPSLFPSLEPNVEFSVLVKGTVSDRIHVNVDYDQKREDFSAANNINVFYQGFPDEILQRVQVGDVDLRLPTSRYLTRGVPAGNFGFMASGQLGPMDFQTVYAQQKGDLSTREFRLAAGGAGAQQGLVQDEQLVLDDADYAKGQFFFVINPAAITGAPHIDVLALRASDAPASLRPAQGGTIELYRDERLSAATNQQAQLGIFLARATSADGSLTHTGLFRRLRPGEDYFVHASGLWIMLRSPLRPDEALGIAYVTESGDTVGQLNAEQSPPGVTPTVALVRSPAASHQPGRPTWDLELHNVYRVNSSTGVELASLDVRVSLGHLSAGRTFRPGPNGQVTFLRLFGLDDDAPADMIDFVNVFQPAREEFGVAGTAPIGGTYVVFPTLRPFLDPPAVPTAGLSAAAARALLGADANRDIYENTDPVARDDGGRFRLNFRYRVKVDGLVSTFSLGQFGIRENTERLTVGDRALKRDQDYTIDYELGVVTLTDPQSIFGVNPAAEIRATWEQRSLFEVAPTSVFGASTTWNLGSIGSLSFVGIYQSEKTLYTRPQLGVEPGAIFMGGASANLRFDGGLVDRALARIPGLRTTLPSSITLDGELALSAPNPNRANDAWLDDFEATDEFSLDLRRQQWRLSSRPLSNAGDEGVLPVTDATTVTPFVWQHDIAEGGQIRGSLLPRRDVDNQINIAGNEIPETALWLTFGRQGVPAGDRKWRSFATVLSSTGRDMTRSEFLEVYVNAAAPAPLALVLDIGTISEDAFYVDSLGQTNGSYPDGARWGLNLLDEEASVANHEVWGPDKDARGLWNQNCTAEPLTAYPLGDPRSNCTRGNGVPDTEDLDGNGILDPDDGAYFRYVVHLDRISPYLVRDTAATGTPFRLYRIPLRDGTPVNGASDGTWRFIKHLRITVAGEPGGVKNIVFSRMRIIGSRWTKRDVFGVMTGMFGDQTGAGGGGGTEVKVGPVSRLTDGSAYASPPGVRDQLQDPTSQFGGGGVEFNEKGLRLAYDNLLPGERAEVYLRYPQQPRDLMIYRQLRLWALPKEGRWGPGGDERLQVKIGTDPNNHYIFQTRLRPEIGSRAASSADWLPEIVIEFERWFELREQAEERSVTRGTLAVDTVWSADSTYAVVLEGRGRAPSLAAVRELVFAVYNAGPTTADGEVWLNELRLGTPLRDPGIAGNVSLQLTGDFLTASIGYANRGSLFRQLEETPNYQSTGDLSVFTRVQLDRLLPAPWGLDLPLTVTHSSSDLSPTFLENSDVRAQRLRGLRSTEGGITRVALRIAKLTPSNNPLLHVLLDGIALRLGWNSANSSNIAARSEAGGLDAGLDYNYNLAPHGLGLLPGFLRDLLRALAPARLESSDPFQRLMNARLRLTPQRIGFGSSYFDQENRAFRFDRILVSELDSLVRPIESPRQGLENNAELTLLPFEPLAASFTVRSSRDLLDPERASVLQREQEALASARGNVAGTDLGWETNRSIGTTVNFRPRITDWLRPTYTYTNRYGTDRNASYLELLVEGDDTAAVLQRRFGSDRQISRRIDFQPTELVRSIAGPGADSMTGVSKLLYRLGRSFQRVDLSWNSGLNSQFERERFEPGLGYRFGMGDLESFRIIGGDTASQALERDDRRLTSAIGLPLAGLLTVGYQVRTNEGLDIRGGRRTNDETSWPNLRVSWRRIPLPEGLSNIIQGASIGAGYERIERETLFGGLSQLRTGQEERYPLEMSLTVKGLNAIYTGTITNGNSTDPTGAAEQHRANHSFRLTGTFQPPGFLKSRIPRAVQTVLVFTEDRQRQCRFRPQLAVEDTCVSYVDARTRNLNLTIDTNLSDLLVGVRLGYTGRRTYVGTRSGSSQFQLALFGQFNVEMGETTPGR